MLQWEKIVPVKLPSFCEHYLIVFLKLSMIIRVRVLMSVSGVVQISKLKQLSNIS